MTEKQPYAMRLADELDEAANTFPDLAEPAAELRRLYARNQEQAEIIGGLTAQTQIYALRIAELEANLKRATSALS